MLAKHERETMYRMVTATDWTAYMIDLALVHDNVTGEMLVHRADCPEARRMAAEGHPVMNMFGCEKLPPEEYKRHSCLDGVQRE